MPNNVTPRLTLTLYVFSGALWSFVTGHMDHLPDFFYETYDWHIIIIR